MNRLEAIDLGGPGTTKVTVGPTRHPRNVTTVHEKSPLAGSPMEADSSDDRQWTAVPQWEIGHIKQARRHGKLASTNTTLLREGSAAVDSELAILIAADTQTGGRGRVGRQWFADSGTLALSILDCAVRHGLSSDKIPLIAIIAGVSIAESLEQFASPIQTRLKWPNDVYIDGGKVAGTLVEGVAGHPSRYVLGVGVNVDTSFASAPCEVRDRARSLATVVGRPLERYDLVPVFLERLAENIELASTSFPQIINAFRARCLLSGHEVTWREGEVIHRGHCLGMADDGGLCVRVGDRTTIVYSGELFRVAPNS